METKELLRTEYKKKRKQIHNSAGNEKDEEIFNNLVLLPEYEEATLIFVYCSYRGEADTMRLIDDALSLGINVAAPKSGSDGKMDFYIIESTDDLIKGFCNIPEPDLSRDLILCEDIPDIIIVPGLCFDEKGNRLGYGGGYYDRLFEVNKESVRIGIAYEEQVTEYIPTEQFDERIDILVTDASVRRF